MQIYQPMLFVGLGGTGCRIGAELERRLREELCGPDGTALRERIPGNEQLLPYQLPRCLQFVYADLAEDEFKHIENRAVPDRSHLAAAERTYTMVRELVPPYDTYPEVARSLRLSAAAAVEDWLPPPESEPRVGPLAKGAGQLPTVGRAALFETFRSGLAPARTSLYRAVGEISNSGGHLSRLGGKLRDSVDVFVAFSVAGGTGAGLFYDYLHLIGDVLAEKYRARIFPLVLMPSAFEEGLGGGRPAELNAARAVLDLFRLVDDQNSQVAGTSLDRKGIRGSLSVLYPDGNEIRLRASTAQTAFLFSLSAGMHREDLHRSVVSLLLSLIGTDLPAESEAGQYLDRNFQSFADSFINSASERGVPAATGIGKRGVSTSAVASLTVPVEDLADIVSSRLLAEAITEMVNQGSQSGENNRDLIMEMFQNSNIDPLLQRAPLPIASPPAVDGRDAILAMLNTRKRTMESSINALEQTLAQEVPEMASRFDPRRAVGMAIGDIGAFRMSRVLLGLQVPSDPLSQLGFLKLVEGRRSEPPPPPGMTLAGPVPDIRRKKWWRKVRFADPQVRAAIQQQDDWFTWRAQRAWHAAWNQQAPRWEPKLRVVEREITALVEGFHEHARTEDARFTRRAKALYEPRVGVSYLLPRQGQLPNFYAAALRRLLSVYVTQYRLHATATPAMVVDTAIGPQGWNAAVAVFQEFGLVDGPGRAVGKLRDLIKGEVTRIFRYSDDAHQPLLARLHDLLTAAAGSSRGLINDDDLAQFKEKLAGLVPGGFAPGGRGRLKILFSYPSPAGKRDVELEKFLRNEVNLPREIDSIPEFRPIDAESIAVVLFRSSMGLTEVPEVQKILMHWAEAVADPRKNDFLQWRQRTGYRFGYLATTGEDRARILHHMLCAAWNGYIRFTGNINSPDRIELFLGESKINMQLELTKYAKLSSWSSVLTEYERWVLADSEQIRQDFCDRLMDTQPIGLTRDLIPPAGLFRALVELADVETKQIEEQLSETRASGRRRLEAVHEFWSVTFRDALALSFRGAEDAHQDNLADLYEWVLK